MASFALFYPILLHNEGGYSTDPHDLGGETFAGIARKFWPNWQGWALIDLIKKRYPKEFGRDYKQNRKFSVERLFVEPKLLPAVESFYRANFWGPMQLDNVANQAVANMLCDHGVNAGTKRGEALAQWVLRESFGHTSYQLAGDPTPHTCAELGLDGQLGRHSLAALNAVNPANFFARYRDVREEFYRYRAGAVLSPAAPAARVEMLRRLHTFFRTVLNYWPGEDVPQGHLDSWLARTKDITFSA